MALAGDGGVAAPDRAVQARHLRRRDRRFPRPRLPAGLMAKPKAARPPIVMIHGAFCGPWTFDQFRAPFEAAGYTVHAPALRFHAMGTKPARALGATSLLDFAQDLADFIATLPAPPILIGHSLGGLLAQMLAAKVKAPALV